MPAPVTATYSAAAKVVAHTAFRDLIDAGTGAGKVFILDDSDVVLAEIPLNSPSGSINGTTGQLTFDIAGPDTSADATGTAAYCQFADGDDVVYLEVPAELGVAAVSGKIVLNTLSIVAGGPVSIVSAVIG